MEPIKLSDKLVYPFSSREALLHKVLDKKKILIAINAEKILNKDARLREIINDNIGYPDGIGAVWALKKKHVNSIKIPGVELWLDVIKTNEKDKKIFLLGSKEQIIIKTVDKLKKDFPSLNIVGYHNGYINEEVEQRIIEEILEKKPDIVFVAMGSPKQEFLMARMIKEYPSLYMGLGGSFDVYCGNVKRAPWIFQKLNMEWSYRLLSEPIRIKRQLKLVPFFFKLMFNRI